MSLVAKSVLVLQVALYWSHATPDGTTSKRRKAGTSRRPLTAEKEVLRSQWKLYSEVVEPALKLSIGGGMRKRAEVEPDRPMFGIASE
ncbi:unnamed protein product, partial [Amoebophrya sp. A120]|eukprot:GSA120T00011382001.1